MRPDQPMAFAQLGLAPPDVDGVGQEQVGTGKVNSACHSGSSFSDAQLRIVDAPGVGYCRPEARARNP
jgi:hypothetical protein